jgi:DNA-binding CsgD family transcriptional regulator
VQVTAAAAALERELPIGSVDHVALRRLAAALVRPRIRHDLGVWATVDPLTTMWTSCVLDGFDRDPALEQAIFENEYGVPDELKLRDMAGDRVARGAGALALRTGGDPASSARFRDVYEPRGVTDELRVLLDDGRTVWGAVVLLRTDGVFDRSEVAVARAIARPVALRLRAALLRETAAAAAGGVLLCDESGHVLDLDARARALLASASDGLRTALAAIVARFVAGAGAEGAIALPGGAGWITVSCSRLSSAVVVTIDRLRPDRMAEVLVAAAGLTAREQGVLTEVLAGATTRKAAERLRMSEHTVNDHLKHVFTKFEVGTRSELVAKLFVTHYLGPHQRGERPSAAGHYLTSAAASSVR